MIFFFSELAIAGLFALAVWFIFWRYPLLVAGLIVTSSVLSEIVNLPGINIGLYLYREDIIFGFAAAVGLVRLLTGMRKMDWRTILVLVLFADVSLAIVRGVLAYGVKAAGNEGRGVFYFLAGVLYFATFTYTPERQRRLATLWFWASGILVGVAIYRWTTVELGWGTGWADIYGGDSGRALTAVATMVIAVGFLLSLNMNLSRQGNRWQRLAYLFLGGVIVLLQHRTVWFGLAIVMLWLAIRDRRFRRRSLLAFGGIALMAGVIIAVIFGEQSGRTVDRLQKNATYTDTFVWRYEGWQELLASPRSGMWTYVVGDPFGAGYERKVNTSDVTVSPHNYYVQLLLRVGAVGLFLFLAIYVAGFRVLKRFPRGQMIWGARLWEGILLLQLLYCITYSLNYEQSILLGFLLAILRQKQTIQTANPATPAMAAVRGEKFCVGFSG